MEDDNEEREPDPDAGHELQVDRDLEAWSATIDARGPRPCEGCGKPTARWHGSTWKGATGTNEAIHYHCGDKCAALAGIPF